MKNGIYRNILIGLVVLFSIGFIATGAMAQASPDAFGAPLDLDDGMNFGDDPSSVVTTSAFFTAPSDGRPAELYVTATLAPGWHIYSNTQPDGGPVRTEIKVNPSPTVSLGGTFQALVAPHSKREPLFDNIIVETHEESVTWRAPLKIQPGVDLNTLKITGAIFAQPCSDKCLMPQDFAFTASLGKAPATEGSAQSPPITSPPAISTPGSPSAPTTVGQQPVKAKKIDKDALAAVIGLAFLGGIILNFMPCVLPVISLKLFSFVQQGGESRGRVFMLNVWYALGLLFVFMILATLAATAGLAWGEQFTLPWFKVAMTALVFVMALSFLGVWEIPIPGFVGSGKAGQLQTKEGVGGAFAKGAFATILATPCSGPFLGPVFGYLLKQPPYMAYVVFGSVGLGMASPYLVIGAFPRLIAFLPKPGEWMSTLQQVMGFLLLGTVVYLFSTMSSSYFVPTLSLLVGLWFACWWIGRTPLTASDGARWTAWLGGLGTAAVVGFLAFTLLFTKSEIPWQPFSPSALAAARSEGKTVMVDFTASWCPTCKANSKFAIEKPAVAELIKKNDVVPLLADWTDRSPKLKKVLNNLGRNSIPILAIWPAGASDKDVIILDDVITQGQLLEALTKAGPSKEKIKADIPWQPFSPLALSTARAEGKTVLVNFTAKWDTTSAANSKLAIEKPAVAKLIEKNKVVPLLADLTNRSPVIYDALKSLGHNSSPVLAIWPAGTSDKDVIILDDIITQGQLLKALEAAGPSKGLQPE